jgi:purine-nucleoside/S-methyl-5'-thioadenosine phosphorylase / adenosine deaminase
MMLDTREIILPTPGSAFEWRPAAAGPVLVCRELERRATHLFTTNHWPLGARTTAGDDHTAWEQVARGIDLTFDMLHRPRQVHGKAVVRPSANSRIAPGDIIITNDPLLGLAVQSADCVPLLFVDPTTKAVAAAHAGWRGLAAGVPLVAVQAMTKNFGSRPTDLYVALGPSIGACCYEVGRDVRDAFAAGFSDRDLDRWFSEEPKQLAGNPSMPQLGSQRRPAHWFFDGWTSVRDQLQAAGVPPDRIFSADLCTASHPNVLCSYRRDGTPTGRMAAAIRSQPLRP